MTATVRLSSSIDLVRFVIEVSVWNVSAPPPPQTLGLCLAKKKKKVVIEHHKKNRQKKKYNVMSTVPYEFAFKYQESLAKHNLY